MKPAFLANTVGGAGGASRRVLNGERLSRRVLGRLTFATTSATATITSSSSNINKGTTTATTTSRSWTCPQCSHNGSINRLVARTSIRAASSSSNSQWKARQSGDKYAKAAKVAGWKSRAAYKLLEIDQTHSLFKRNQTIVDLGYAPGSWSQVAIDRVGPDGVVVGIDLIPAQPPRGVTGIQGNFLSPQVRRLLKDVLLEQLRRKTKERALKREAAAQRRLAASKEGAATASSDSEVLLDRPSYIDREKQASHDMELAEAEADEQGRFVNVVLSDMCDPWPQTGGFQINTLSRPYRLMNTSGIALRDHVLSMDLCHAALQFASENLRPGGHFVCKFYQGAEDSQFQKKLLKMFESVRREKPDSSRPNSRESFFVALKRKGDVTLADIEEQLI